MKGLAALLAPFSSFDQDPLCLGGGEAFVRSPDGDVQGCLKALDKTLCPPCLRTPAPIQPKGESYHYPYRFLLPGHLGNRLQVCPFSSAGQAPHGLAREFQFVADGEPNATAPQIDGKDASHIPPFRQTSEKRWCWAIILNCPAERLWSTGS